MKIALIGYGKMGKIIEQIALKRGHEVIACISSSTPLAKESVREADVCIEFTHPESALDNIKKLASFGKNLVIGTTGWYEQIDLVKALVKQHSIGALYAPNFSIGVQLLLKIIGNAAEMLSYFPEYDLCGIEYHHRQKVDCPSGTAKAIADLVEEKIDAIEELPFSSIRCGTIPGIHTLLCDSPCDRITITHEAKNREGFALGAVQAAEWVAGKKGLYHLDDFMEELFRKKPMQDC